MINADNTDRKKLAFLFEGIQDSMVISYLQGYLGTCYVDRLPDPQYGVIISGEYSFYGGNAELAEPLLANLFEYIKGDKSTAIYADHKWCDMHLRFPQNHAVEVPRNGIVQKDYDFDLAKLERMSQDIPEGFQARFFDMDIYEQAVKEDWSVEFVECYESPESFFDKGFGVAIIESATGKLVAGASTQTVYDGGAETQLATHPDYRGRGLAKAAAAGFVLEGCRRGIRICWDAANLTSKHIALSLGFEDAGVYSTIHVKR